MSFRPAVLGSLLGALFFSPVARAQEAAPAPAPVPAPPAEPEAEAGEPDAPEPGEEPAPQPAEPGEPAPSVGLPPPAEPGALPGFAPPGPGATSLQGVETKRPEPAPEAEEADAQALDWWTNARAILEIHGYFRFRAELFHHFSLGRIDPPREAFWPRPADDRYTDTLGQSSQVRALCTLEETDRGSSDDPTDPSSCKAGTQRMANVRLRLNPEIHISDNLRVITQIDLLDNLVLGSTPGGYRNRPSGSAAGGYDVAPRSGYEAIGFYDETTSPPRSGINSLQDSISVKRAWGEYATPVGQLRFGRMPNHWGLGMVNHSGDGYDDDAQSTIDRLQFIGDVKPLELYIAGAWDFPNEGATSDQLSIARAQPYDVAQHDDVDQYVISVARKKSPELQRLGLSRGDLVLNGGLELTYRKQLLAADAAAGCQSPSAALGCVPGDLQFVRRDAHYWRPDLWLQLLYRKFRFESELATVRGEIQNLTLTSNPNIDGDEGYNLRQWGLVTEIEQLLAEDRLHLGFGFGWASGDADVDGLLPIGGDTQGQLGNDRDLETFRFNSNYRVDLILWRNIFQRVQGAYYFRPNLRYDFAREPTGQRIGGSIMAIWSRASQFIQAPGHERDLGIELDAAVDFQSKDGALNDDPNEMGGFYARLEYGILFPMAGLGYPDRRALELEEARRGSSDTHSAQILRLYLGALF